MSNIFTNLSDPSGEKYLMAVYSLLIKQDISLFFQTFKQTQRGQKVEGKIPKLQLLHSYVSYLRYTKQVERNLLIIDSLEQALATGRSVEGKKVPKPQDIVRLFDIIVQVGISFYISFKQTKIIFGMSVNILNLRVPVHVYDCGRSTLR